jgi:hypothetical protein
MKLSPPVGLATTLLASLFALGAHAQESFTYDGVFEGIVDGRAFIRTEPVPDARWTVESFTQFLNGNPGAGDWIRASVDRYGRLLSVQIEEYPTRYAATVDHTDGLTIAARTTTGMVYLQDVPTTWHIGVEPGGLMQGDQIDVAAYRNQTLAYVRLDARNPNAVQTLPPSTGPAPGLGSVNGDISYEDGQPMIITSAPPALPYYDIPPCSEPDSLWIPGYWAWGPFGFYWVGGYWTLAPMPGLFWTPAWWGFEAGFYRFHPGYWGHHVGYYGGINYGGGYYGEGFVGARWHEGHVEYNTAVIRIDGDRVHHEYHDDHVVIRGQEGHIRDFHPDQHASRPSFNGPGGIRVAPSAGEQKWSQENRVMPTHEQQDRAQRARATPPDAHTPLRGAPALPVPDPSSRIAVPAAPRPAPAPVTAPNPAATSPAPTPVPAFQPRGNNHTGNNAIPVPPPAHLTPMPAPAAPVPQMAPMPLNPAPHAIPPPPAPAPAATPHATGSNHPGNAHPEPADERKPHQP